MSIDLFKELLPNLLQGKEPILEEEKDYNPYITNRALTAYLDTILYANQMNQFPGLDRKMQYDYLFYSIRKKRRPFQPWMKAVNDETLSAICEYFQCSRRKGKENINILTKDQIKEIIEIVRSKNYA